MDAPPAGSRMVEFEGLLQAQLGAAYRTAYRLTGGSADAEDLVQEASLRAWRGFGSFEPGTNFRGWFLRILTNAFRSRYRRAQRRGQPVTLEDAPELYLWRKSIEAGRQDVLDNPAETLVARLDSVRINRAIAELPEEYRVVAALYFVEDLSYQEIAETVAIPMGTVRSRLFRARRQLQVALWEVAREMGLTTKQEGSP